MYQWSLIDSTQKARWTSNVTCRHRGTKRKLQHGYRAPSLKRTSCCDYFSSLHMVSGAFSALCMYSKFEHHPNPLGYLCVKFRFFRGLHFWASPWRKITHSINHSITHSAYSMPREPKLALQKIVILVALLLLLHVLAATLHVQQNCTIEHIV